MRARLDGGQIKLKCGKPYTTADFNVSFRGEIHKCMTSPA